MVKFSRIKKQLIKAAIAFMPLIFLSGPAFADGAGSEIGKLTCRLTDVKNVIVFTEQDFDCQFKPTKGNNESYIGRIKKVGIDLSIKKDAVIIWGVLAATNAPSGLKALAGTYVGVGADVSIGAGVGAKLLVGGSKDAFSLQPLSVSGIKGGGASVGLESFELK
jgi:Protein of unknown function (DUF992)